MIVVKDLDVGHVTAVALQVKGAVTLCHVMSHCHAICYDFNREL